MTDLFHTIEPWQEEHIFKAAAIILKDRHARISIHFRDDFDHVFAGGKWGYFAGAVEPGENLEQAAVRELFEETGIRAQANEMRPVAKGFSETGDGAHHYVYLLDRVVCPSEITLNEGAGFAFIHHGQLDKFDLLPIVKRVLAYYFTQNS